MQYTTHWLHPRSIYQGVCVVQVRLLQVARMTPVTLKSSSTPTTSAPRPPPPPPPGGGGGALHALRTHLVIRVLDLWRNPGPLVLRVAHQRRLPGPAAWGTDTGRVLDGWRQPHALTGLIPVIRFHCTRVWDFWQFMVQPALRFSEVGVCYQATVIPSIWLVCKWIVHPGQVRCAAMN
jgi:hypothetical protein